MSEEKKVSRRKWIKYTGAGVVVAAAVAGAGYYAMQPKPTPSPTTPPTPTPTPTPTVPTPKPKPTELSLIAHPVHYTITGDGELFRQYEQMTGTRVTMVRYTHTVIREKVLMELAAGSGVYDIVYLTEMLWSNNLGSKSFVNLEPRFGEIKDFDDFFQPMVNIFRARDGAVVALPIRSGFWNLCYRKDLFEKQGISRLPKTPDELADVAKALTDRQKGVYGWSFHGKEAVTLYEEFYQTLIVHGGDVLDKDMKVRINEKAGVEALQWMYDMLHTHNVCPPGVLTFTPDEHSTAIMEGNVAMAFTTYSYLPMKFENPQVSKVVGKIELMPNIVKPGLGMDYGPSHTFIWALFIPVHSKYVDATWDFMKWFLNKENQIYMMKKGNGPIRISAMESPDFVKTYGEKRVKIITDAGKQAKILPPVPQKPMITDIIANEVSMCLTKKKSANEAINSMAERIKKAME